MAFTEIEEKEIILKWIYSVYKKLGNMTLEEMYLYLLSQSKEGFVQEASVLVDKLNAEKAEEETIAVDFQKNAKELKKKWEKL